jgi:hypothetical protein
MIRSAGVFEVHATSMTTDTRMIKCLVIALSFD